jgi:hypothetical protein
MLNCQVGRGEKLRLDESLMDSEAESNSTMGADAGGIDGSQNLSGRQRKHSTLQE